MASDTPVPRNVPGLSPEVLTRIVTELAPNGHTVLEHLRTAAALIAQARTDGVGLRLAESAAYNLREALDRVVEGRPPPQGGIGAVLEVWERYKLATAAPGASADMELARTELDAAVERLAQYQERQAYKTQKLLEYVRHQTGIDPLPGEDDPTVRYSRLRARANATLHEQGTLSNVAALYDETVAWFIRFFTPPDDRVRAVAALAERPYAEGLVEELRERVLNSHHLRLFFSRLQDPAWLDPLHDAGLVGVPREGEPWPVTFLVEAGTIPPARVAEVLDRLLLDSRHEDEVARLRTAREIVQTASRLGAAGHEVAKKVMKKYPADQWVQMIAISIAKEADPSAPIQTAIADAILGNDKTTHDGHHAGLILGRLTEGLTTDNAAQRVGLVAAKLRRLARDERMRFVVLDIASLKTNGDDFREPVLILSHHLVLMIPIARRLGLSTGDLLRMVEGIPGELGERITCQVLAGAEDVDREEKIGHIAQRVASETATGDDRDLIQDILTAPLSSEELERWRKALGEPSPQPPEEEGPEAIGDNWARAWRWSLVLPEEVLEGWEEAIEAVAAQHGVPSRSALDTRLSPVAAWGSSPYSAEELAAVPVLDAAGLISRWGPSKDDWGVSALELARSLQAVVKSKPREWTENPCGIVRALREPVYVDHYFRGIREMARHLPDRVPAVLAAVKLVRAERWQPIPLGRDDWDYEPDWSGVDLASVEMIGAFANNEGELGADLDLCWKVSTEVVRDLPEELPEIEPDRVSSRADDPLHRAINKPYGNALDSVLAIGGWEHRNRGAASPRLVEVLDNVVAVPGAVGLELRSVLARSPALLGNG